MTDDAERFKAARNLGEVTAKPPDAAIGGLDEDRLSVGVFPPETRPADKPVRLAWLASLTAPFLLALIRTVGGRPDRGPFAPRFLTWRKLSST
jgi:hypothetical protein